jgi:hypothetical protein
MEIALNLLWLSVTLCALAAWKFRWSRRRAPQPDSLPQSARFGALCCALVLLFFVISVSDDLQQATGLIEDSASRGSSPYKSKFHRTGAHNLNAAPADAANGMGFLLLHPRACVGRIHPYENLAVSHITRLSFAGRAPPFSTQ